MEATRGTATSIPGNGRDFWGGGAPGMSLNYFADRLRVAYLRDTTGKGLGDYPVLRRCEPKAMIRREAFACSVAHIRNEIAYAITQSEFDGPWRRLPRVFHERYDRAFYRRLLALSMNLWERMSAGTFTSARCTAEEILLGIILTDYNDRLHDQVFLDHGYVDLDGQWLQDDDYLMLYHLEVESRDAVLEALAGPPIYTSYLDFDLWFKPFRKTNKIPGLASLADVREFGDLPTFRWSDQRSTASSV